jgi:hypothetical protein
MKIGLVGTRFWADQCQAAAIASGEPLAYDAAFGAAVTRVLAGAKNPTI